ncbi:hypothetical protein EV714DRAFT_285004 [Schizophyllum commune]
MPNPSGSNGHRNGELPENISAILHDFARRGLKNEARTAELRSKHGYNISITKLKRLNNTYSVPSKRKLPPMEEVTTRVLEKMDQDIAQRNGPQAIADQLRTDPYDLPLLIGRDVIRGIMRLYAPEGSAARQPGFRRPTLDRGSIVSAGLLAELHLDGHEKVSFASLRMGEDIGVPIYGGREQLSGRPVMYVVPNDRDRNVVAHCYLDIIEEFGLVAPLQITIDKGTETAEIIRIQEVLRGTLTPDLDPLEFPPFLQLRSVQNIVIESIWSWLRKTNGVGVREEILRGKTDGIFSAAIKLHCFLFRWIWPQIVQRCLNQFIAYWNLHKTRYQADKANPSGEAPMEIWNNHDALGYECVGMQVPPELLAELRASVPVSRDDAYRWVPEEFAELAEHVYVIIGSPQLDVRSGWRIFEEMFMKFNELYPTITYA